MVGCLNKSYVIEDKDGTQEHHYDGEKGKIEEIKQRVNGIVGEEFRDKVGQLEAHLLHELDQKCDIERNDGKDRQNTIEQHVNHLSQYSNAGKSNEGLDWRIWKK